MSFVVVPTNDINGNKNIWDDTKRLHVVGNIVPTGNYAVGGVVIDTSNPLIKSNSHPLYVHLTGQINKYKFTYNQATNKIQIFDAGAELGAGALPAAISGDILNFYGIFPKYI